MNRHILLAVTVILLPLCISPSFAGEVIFQDHFERNESDESKEQLGNGWGTNSKTRAGGNKQVDLNDGALYIYRHATADHGVSVVQDMSFQNATISMRFRIGKGDELGINIADMNEKSVHAGHICVAKVRPYQVSILDLKTGRMKLEVRERSKANKLTTDDKKLIATKQSVKKAKVTPDQWHALKVVIAGDTMTVSIDDKVVNEFTSPGIGHDTKSRLRLAVAKEAWVDDLKVVRD